jgi:hypothetical protein
MAKKNNNWLIWIFAIISVVALVLAIVALNNAGVTGEAINWNKPKANIIDANSCKVSPTTYSTITYGLLGSNYLNNKGSLDVLKGYEVKYDSNGKVVYEIINNKCTGNCTGKTNSCTGGNLTNSLLMYKAVPGVRTLSYPQITSKQQLEYAIENASKYNDTKAFDRLVAFGIENKYLTFNASATNMKGVSLGPLMTGKATSSVGNTQAQITPPPGPMRFIYAYWGTVTVGWEWCFCTSPNGSCTYIGPGGGTCQVNPNTGCPESCFNGKVYWM